MNGYETHPVRCSSLAWIASKAREGAAVLPTSAPETSTPVENDMLPKAPGGSMNVPRTTTRRRRVGLPKTSTAGTLSGSTVVRDNDDEEESSKSVDASKAVLKRLVH